MIAGWLNTIGMGSKDNETEQTLVNIGAALSSLTNMSKEIDMDNNLKETAVLSTLIHNINDKIPRIVVVGTQSSGKSSLLNRILNFPILPVGSAMVTRTPISIEMRTCPDCGKEKVHVGTEGKLHTIIIDRKSEEECIEKIKNAIRHATDLIAGSNKGISKDSIIVKAELKNIPNLNLTDLPGLTLTALRDQGQPEDIKQQLIELARHYCSFTNTIVLGVFPARPDLEADYAFSILKTITNTDSIIGVLTKPDLVEDQNSLKDILEGHQSLDLQLKQGYFVVRTDVNETEESAWFNSTWTAVRERTGVDTLSHYCSKMQLELLRLHIPQLQDTIISLEKIVSNELTSLSSSVPNDDHGKMQMALSIITNISRLINNNVLVKGNYLFLQMES